MQKIFLNTPKFRNVCLPHRYKISLSIHTPTTCMSTQSQWIKISNYKQANINSQRKTEGQPSPWIDRLKIASTCHTCPMTQREALMVTWELDKTARCSQGPIDLCYILDVYKLVQCWTLYKLYLWIVSIYTSLQ